MLMEKKLMKMEEKAKSGKMSRAEWQNTNIMKHKNLKQLVPKKLSAIYAIKLHKFESFLS